jgi:hypothetical protein
MATPAPTFLEEPQTNGVAKIEGFLSLAEAD